MTLGTGPVLTPSYYLNYFRKVSFDDVTHKLSNLYALQLKKIRFLQNWFSKSISALLTQMFNGTTSSQQFLQSFLLETSQETFIKFDPGSQRRSRVKKS
jgi:hypothetical protein